MNKLTFPLAVLILALFASKAVAAERDMEPVAGRDYALVVPKQPVQTGNKIEVLEIFWFGCPHCYALEPYLDKWLTTTAQDVEFRRMPGIFRESWVPHAKAFYTAKELGVLDNIYQPLFDAIHQDQQRLDDEDSLAAFFTKHGVDEQTFRDTYNSFGVDSQVRQATHMSRQYGLTGVPAIVVGGKYHSSGRMAGSYHALLKVTDHLVDKVRAEKAAED